MEGRRDRVEGEPALSQVDRSLYASCRPGRGPQQAVVRADQQPPAARPQRDGTPLGADSRIDNCKQHSGREEGHRVLQDKCAMRNVPRGQVVGDVDHGCPGAIRLITPRQTPTHSSR